MTGAISQLFGNTDRGVGAAQPAALEIRERGWLAALLVLALVFRVSIALRFPTIHHPDEVFQYLEQGHRLAFGYGAVPWEFRSGARLWFIPAFLGGIMKVVAALGGGPAAYMVAIAVILSALSLSIVAVAFLWARRLAGSDAAVLAGAVAATWFELVYFAPKPLAEILATYPLVVGAYLTLSGGQRSRSTLVVGGALLGLAVMLRMQLAPAVGLLVFAIWMRSSRGRTIAVASGAALIVLAAGALDWWTWGTPFHSFASNFAANVLQRKASTFGTSPWYQYLGHYVSKWAGAIVPLSLLALLGARRLPLLLGVPLAILLSHSAVDHKEYRFVFPALPFVLLAASLGTSELIRRIVGAPRPGLRLQVLAAAGCWAIVSAASAVGTQFAPLWSRGSGYIAAYVDIRRLPSVCGVGLLALDWANTAGYTFLHREIPMLVLEEDTELASLEPGFNVVLSPAGRNLERFGYRLARCYPNGRGPAVCVHVRDGGCAPVHTRTLNEYLVATGQ